MQDQDPTVRSRELGRLLSDALATIGMNQIALARELDWSPSTVSRMISGKRPVSAELMSGVLGVLRVTGEQRRYIMKISRAVAESGWLREVGDRQPARNVNPGNQNPEDEILVSSENPANMSSPGEVPGREALNGLEDSAATMVVFEPNCIPDMLRTAEYMTAIMKAKAAIPADEIDARVNARLARHGDLLDRKGPADLLFFIDEYALCRSGAGRDAMSIQVHHLLCMAVRPRITIRVIPEAAGFHAGTKGQFQLLAFKDGNPIVCVENETSIVFLEREETITAYRDIVAELSRVAHGEPQTRTWLSSLAARLGAQQDDANTPRTGGIFELDEDQDDQREVD
ncbi:MAG: helix-turn-helix domain-containing protein [Actinophytocola sp.]|uniref:helix-turn-helix domain-containing protein n=1 Tax=Actinophytocola sp. TaxID=1872138 RepID=UPI001320CF21|nr:helix-turn-helix transcriptional regulator [Actinophytocola sp.]MPZ80878.1 helix-turn-helix domain-containing protein [Actinophytocola sp.]